MVSSRTATALVGAVLSVGLSVAAWYYFDAPVFLFVLPFVPFLFRSRSSDEERPPVRECPVCGFRTRDESYDYCPRDGERLR